QSPTGTAPPLACTRAPCRGCPRPAPGRTEGSRHYSCRQSSLGAVLSGRGRGGLGDGVGQVAHGRQEVRNAATLSPVREPHAVAALARGLDSEVRRVLVVRRGQPAGSGEPQNGRAASSDGTWHA